MSSCPTPKEWDHGAISWAWRDWLAALAYLFLAHAVFYPALRPGVFLYGRDTTAHDLGLLLYNWSQVVDQGRLGLWNPYLFCGLPSLGTFASCPFYPIGWFFVFLPAALAFTYQYVLNDWLAGLWTYWAARWMGLRRTAAFLAGAIFMASGHVVTLAHAGHLQKFAAIAWMPFVFGCATAAMKRRRWRWWAACGVGLAAQLLASHVQIAYYTILFLVPRILWLAWDRLTSCPASRTDEHFWDRLTTYPTFGIGGLALALVVAAGLSAAQILPSIETTPLTNRGAGLAFDEVATTSYPPFEFVEYLLPGFLGDSTGGPDRYRGEWGSWGQPNRQGAERIVSDYMGLLPWMLIVFGLTVGWRDRNRWFWLAVMLIAGVLATGGYTPVFRAAFRWLPGLKHFRSPGTIMVFIAWPAAILAACGFEDFVERAVRDQASRGRYLVVLAVAAIAFVSLRFVLTASEVAWPTGAALGGSASRQAIVRTAMIWSSVQRSLLFAGLACAALAVVAASGRWAARGNKTVFALGCGLVFLLAFVDPRLHESPYIRAADFRVFQLYLVHHWSDSILRTLPQPVRGIEVGNEYSNRMMTRGIGSLHGYHPVHLQEYVDLLNLYAQNHAQLGRLVFEQFILAAEGKSPGRDYERQAAENGQVLWLRRPPPPYAYFPEQVEVVADRATLLAAMARADFDPYRRSYTLDPGLAHVGQVANLSSSTDERTTAAARVIHYSPDRIDLEVLCDSKRPLIVAELAAPGWQWILDSTRPLKPSMANHAFRAARVPAGDHVISLVYRPFSLRMGLYVSLAFVLLLAVVFPTRRRA